MDAHLSLRSIVLQQCPWQNEKKKKLQGKKVFTFLNSEGLPPSSNKVQNRHKNELQNLRNGNNNR